MAIKNVQRPFTVTQTTGTSATLTEETGTTSDKKIVTVKTVTDDGAGNLGGGLGTIAYAAREGTLRVVQQDRTTNAYKSDYEDAKTFETAITDGSGSSDANRNKGGSYSTASVGEEMFAGASLVARYRTGAGVPRTKVQSFVPPGVVLDLCPYTTHRIVPNCLRFRWMGQVYDEFEGVIYRGRTDTSPGIASGTLDYARGHALMTDYVVGGTGPTDFQLLSLFTEAAQWSTSSIFFNTEAAPLRPGAGGFVMTVVDTQGTTLTAAVDAQGNISGPHQRGKVEFSRGGVAVQYGDFIPVADLTLAELAEWWYNGADVGAVQAGKVWRPWPVLPNTLRYSAVSYIYLPVDVGLMGIDPAALPPDGLVVFARPGDTAVIGITHGGAPFAPSIGVPYDVGHERLSLVQVLGPDGAEIFSGYTTDLDAGTVTFTDLTDYPAEVSVLARQEVYRQIAEVRVDGSVRFTEPVGMTFPVGAVFSTAIRFGDRFARVTRVYDQASWNGTTWYDGVDPVPGPAVPSYNHTNHPIGVNNLGTVTERWALRFRSDGQTFDLHSQNLGSLGLSGTINTDFSPMHVNAGAPYLVLKAAGWGGPWPGGSVLFIDTVGAEFPIHILRCTQPGTPDGIDHSCLLLQRGDVGRPPEADL